MLKRSCVLLWTLLILLSFNHTEAKAGNLTLGVKAWYETTWDSGVLDIFTDLFADTLRAADNVTYTRVDYESFIGYGYLAGPVLGYQTSNGKWTFSVAPMILSNYSQSVRGTALVTEAFGTVLPAPVTVVDKVEVDVTRVDYDFAVSYAFSDANNKGSLLDYTKAYLGLKYQQVDYEFTSNTQIMGLVQSSKIPFDYEVYMPTAGVGFAYPMSQDIFLGLQGGVGVALFEGLNVEDSLTFNIEANISFNPVDNLIMQIGYRYQQFNFNLQDNDTGRNYNSTDQTYGPTLTITYAL